MSTTLPNIGIVVPASGDTDYPTSINTSLTNTDNHDHTTGKGLPIGTNAISNLAVTTAKIDNLAVTSGKIAAGAVLRDKLVAVGQQVSSSCGTFSTSNNTLTDVTNLSVTITTTGRPVIVALIHDGSAFEGWIGGYQQANDVSGPVVTFAILRDATVIARQMVWGNDTAVPLEYHAIARIPSSSLQHFDVVAAGQYTYKVQAARDSVTSTANTFAEVYRTKLIAYEL